MSEYYSIQGLLPGVYQITEPMGVSTALFVGAEKALLVDTGYGLGNLLGTVRSITTNPLTVLNSHYHWDHSQGNHLFDRVYISRADHDLLLQSDDRALKERTVSLARDRGCLPEGFDEERYLCSGAGNLQVLEKSCFDLGGMTVECILVPGHTPGSLVFYTDKYQLLLTADSWNPTTWLFFPYSAPVMRYSKTMASLLNLPFVQLLCSHSAGLFPRERLASFIIGLTPKTLSDAQPSLLGERYGVKTRLCYPEPGTAFVFNPDNV